MNPLLQWFRRHGHTEPVNAEAEQEREACEDHERSEREKESLVRQKQEAENRLRAISAFADAVYNRDHREHGP